MGSSVFFGVELPPVPAARENGLASTPSAHGSPRGVEEWWAAARVAVAAGAGTIWFSGQVHGLGTRGSGASCDACTIAAASVEHVRGVHLGVVSVVPADRHPGLLAREVTALDVVSGGRAAVLLRWASPDTLTGLLDAVEQLAEAVAVCGAVLRDVDPVFEGRHYHLAGAVNRPAPIQQGAPPVFAEAPAGAAAVASARDPKALAIIRLLLGAASGIVCSDDAGEIATWRTLLDEVDALYPGTRDPAARPVIVCRTTLRDPVGTAGAGPELAVARLHAAHAAGAAGVIVRMPATRRSDLEGSGAATAASASDLGGALAARFAPWSD